MRLAAILPFIAYVLLQACSADPFENSAPTATAKYKPFDVVESAHIPHTNIMPTKEGGMFEMYGYGTTPLDFDGDTYLDLLVGSLNDRSEAATLYKNISTVEKISFKKYKTYGEPGEYRFAGATDINGDNHHEMILFGLNSTKLVQFYPAEKETELMDQLPKDDPHRKNLPLSYLPFDFNLDGKLDLMLGYGNITPELEENKKDRLKYYEVVKNLVFLQNDAGGFDFVPDQQFVDDGKKIGITLALASTDLNDDGLQDLAMANDSFVKAAELSESNKAKTKKENYEPGGYYKRLSKDLGLERIPFEKGIQAWGSYMGFGQIYTGKHSLYTTNWGPNKNIELKAGDICVDTLAESGLDLPNSAIAFSWGVAVSDLTGNGLDDLIVTQGHPVRSKTEINDNWALLQTSLGEFEPRPLSVQHLGVVGDEVGAMSRAIYLADLNYDGVLDFVISGFHGSPQILSEGSPPKNLSRCTVHPKARYVEGYGTGYALRNPGDEIWRSAGVQGQISGTTSPWVMSSTGKGELRFPSGYTISYDCKGKPGPIDVIEPEWLNFARHDGGGSIELVDRDNVLVELFSRNSSETDFVQEPLVLDKANKWIWKRASKDYLLKIDGRYVGRIF